MFVVSRRSRSPPLSGTFERSHGFFHKHREVKRSRSNQFSREMFPAACPYLVLFYMLRACCTSEPVQTGSNWFKPGKTQEKRAPSAVAAGYINRAATAIAITTVLRSLQSTSRCRDSSDTPSFVSIYYILSLFVSQSFSDLCTPISRITSNDEIHMFKMQQSVWKKIQYAKAYKNGV